MTQTQTPIPNMVDISNNQGPLPTSYFQQLVSMRIKTIAIKACEFINESGSWHVEEDSQFANNWKSALSHNLNRIAYIYCHPEISPTDQAQALKNIAAKYGMSTTDRLMVDVEVPGFTPTYCKALLVALDSAASKPRGTSIFYSYLSYINSHLSGGEGLGDWPLYLADTGITNTPAPPKGWQKVAYWQFGQQVIDKVNTDLDIDETNPPTKKVTPVYSITIEGTIADVKSTPTGGVYLLASSGAIYAFDGAEYYGGANDKPYFANRQAAKLTLKDNGYTITDTAGEEYNYPTS